MAIAPAARLMKPEPRYVTTMPTAIAAIVAPVPRPSRRKRSVSFTSSSWESADGAGVEPAPSDGGSSFVDCYLPGGPIQPDARLNANLPW